jgi:hypothetical protein
MHTNMQINKKYDIYLLNDNNEHVLMNVYKKRMHIDVNDIDNDVINNIEVNIDVNTYTEYENRPLKRRKLDEYLPATGTKYFQNNDSIGYLLNVLNINTVEDLIHFICDNSYVTKKSEQMNFIKNFIFEKGNKFEKVIIDKILNRIKHTDLTFAQIVTDKPNHNMYDQYLRDTTAAMNNNVDIIYQGMIQTNHSSVKCKFRGFPDLIVSGKAFKYLFNNYFSKSTNQVSYVSTSSDNYIIIDIKSSNIPLNVDGITCRNTDLLKLYKLQLATYSYILEENLNSGKVETYLLPHSAKLEYCSDSKDHVVYYNNITDSVTNEGKLFVCKVDVADKDKSYSKQLTSIYEEYNVCRNVYNNIVNGNEASIKFLYDKQVGELQKILSSDDHEKLQEIINCDQMLNLNEEIIRSDYMKIFTNPFVRGSAKMSDRLEVKLWIAKQTRSLSLLRGFNRDQLQDIKYKKGIVSYIQTDSLLNYVDANISRDKSLISNIIKANDPDRIWPIYCRDFKHKKAEFEKTIMNKKMILCLDFETIPNKLITSMVNRHYDYQPDQEYESFGHQQTVFMIGCNAFRKSAHNNGFLEFEDSKRQFILQNINTIEQINKQVAELFKNLKQYIRDLLRTHKLKKADVGFVIWSPFEIAVMKNINSLNFELLFEDHIPTLYGIEIIDLMDMYSGSDAIGVRGAFDCSIKSIAKGLKPYLKPVKIRDEYGEDVAEYWNKEIINGMDAMYYALFYYINMRENIDDQSIRDKFLHICYYNDIDCTIMCQLINATYLLL